MRLLVLWVLSLVLPLQGTALVVVGALGPAHVHVARPAHAAPVLEDFRRTEHAQVVASHLAVPFSHSHAGAAPQRHHHRFDEAGMVRTDAAAADTDDGATVSAVAVLALLPVPAAWAAPAADRHGIPAARWPLRAVTSAPPERPPKPG